MGAFRTAALGYLPTAIDPQHYTGESTQTHLPPMPLGKLGEILARLGETPVQQRPADLYQTIAEELAR